jgi:hypothetical protein
MQLYRILVEIFFGKVTTWKNDKKMQQHHDGSKGFTEFSSQDRRHTEIA